MVKKKGKVMGKNKKKGQITVSEKDVHFVQVGTSGDNYCLTLSKNATIAIKAGHTFPVEFLLGDRKVTIIVLSDATFKRNLGVVSKLNDGAKQSAEATIQANRETEEIGKGIGDLSV